MQALESTKPNNANFDAGLVSAADERYRKTVTRASSQPFSAASNRKKSSILVDATRQFARLDRPNQKDIATYKEMFYQLVETISDEDKRMVSALLARLVYTPRQLALYLSMDRLNVAAPFLLFSPILGDADLTAISRKMGQDYANVIRRRVYETAGPRAGNLIQNNTASALAGAHMPSNLMVESKPSSAKHNASGSETDTPKATMPRTPGEQLVELASAGGRLGKGKIEKKAAEQPSTRPAALPPINIELLYKHARNVEYDLFAKEAAASTGMKAEEILKLVKSTTGEEIVYFVKALGLSPPKDIQLLMMLSPRLGRQVETFRGVRKLLAALDVGVCRMIFNQVGAVFEIPGAPKPTEIQGERQDYGFVKSLNDRRTQISPSRSATNKRSVQDKTFGRKAS